MLDQPLRDGGYTLLAAAATAGLNMMTYQVQHTPVTALTFTVWYELTLGAFGILWAAYEASDDGGGVQKPLIGIGAVFLLGWLSMSLTTENVGFEFGQAHPAFFIGGLPNALAVFMLFWAVATARTMA